MDDLPVQLRTQMIKKFVKNLIRAYQLRGGGSSFWVDCNFEPSCSDYTIESIDRNGLIKGLTKGMKRIRRCNKRDLTKKIYDPVL